jgi:hypothetical protein
MRAAPAKGLHDVLLEMAETYERIAESVEQRRQAPGPQSHPSA